MGTDQLKKQLELRKRIEDSLPLLSLYGVAAPDPHLSNSDNPWKPINADELYCFDGMWLVFTDGAHIQVSRFKYDAMPHFFPNGEYFNFEDAIGYINPYPLPKKLENKNVEES